MSPWRGAGLPSLALVSLLTATPCAGTQAPPEAADSTGGATARWEISGSASGYFLPDERYLLPIVSADRDRLHLEARYNYEERDSGSIFAGANLEHGDRLRLEVTPMAGLVLGDLHGIAPGFELTLSYGAFELYTEFEYVFDLEDIDASFLYNWSELTYAPVDWFRVGLTTQRTRVYQTERDIQRALLLGCSVANVTFTGHLFNLDDDDAFYVFAVGVSF